MSEVLQKQSRKKRLIIILISVTAVLAIFVSAAAIYLGDYYHAQLGAVEALIHTDRITVVKARDNTIIYEPENATAGVIFYPGGKVEYTAYTPLMQALAKKGVLCVLVEMPFNLEVFDVNAADGIQQKYPDIDSWYIGGHSLGGSMAAAYLEDNTNDFNGLVLLGSYSTADLSGADIDVISIFGSEDRVLNKEKYKKYKSNLPSDFTEFIIDGGCHAYFGMYGKQDGDGTPTVTNKEQIDITADKIAEFISD